MDRIQFVAALAAGKAFDATSTIVVLSLRSNVVESTPFVRRLFEVFGLAVGSALSVLVAIVAVAVLAESGVLIRRLLPTQWVPEWYPRMIRIGTYCLAAGWYTFLGVHNFSLLI